MCVTTLSRTLVLLDVLNLVLFHHREENLQIFCISLFFPRELTSFGSAGPFLRPHCTLQWNVHRFYNPKHICKVFQRNHKVRTNNSEEELIPFLEERSEILKFRIPSQKCPLSITILLLCEAEVRCIQTQLRTALWPRLDSVVSLGQRWQPGQHPTRLANKKEQCSMPYPVREECSNWRSHSDTYSWRKTWILNSSPKRPEHHQ